MARPSSIDDLEALLRRPKRLEGALDWKPQHDGKSTPPRNTRVQLVAALLADGVVLEGVQFLAAAPMFDPDRGVAMQLMVLHGGKYRPFTRIDWRGSPHTNRKNPGSRLWLRDAGDTHIHRLDDNAFRGWPGIVAKRDDLPEAEATPPLDDFRTLLAYVGVEFGLENVEQIREPQWQASLFQE